MSDPIMQKLDEMFDIARSSSVPLGVPVAPGASSQGGRTMSKTFINTATNESLPL